MASAFVDVTCSYVPAEVIGAAGFRPRRWLPPPAGAHGGLPRSLCSYARACAGTSGAAAVFTTCCDGMRRCYDLRAARGDPVFLLDLPRTAHGGAVIYFAGELRRLAAWLADLGGRPVTPEALAAARRSEGERRRRLWSRIPDAARASDRYGLYLEAVAASPVRARPAPAAGAGPPVLLTGTCPPDPGFVAAVEESGLLPADLDFCTAVRHFAELSPGPEGDPWAALARAYLAKPPCPRAAGRDVRRAYLHGLLDRTRARGVVVYGFKFCDHTAYDLPLWEAVCRRRRLPLLYLEGEYGTPPPAQFLTRLHAFREALEESWTCTPA